MATPNLPSPSRGLWRLAARDHDIVSRKELRDLGYSESAIRHRLQIGKLHRKEWGVYSVGSPHITREGELMVAVKRCGPGSALSFLTAAVRYVIWRIEPAQIHVTVPRRANPAPDRIAVHRRDLPEGAITLHDGIPITTVLQTLIDTAPNRSRPELERMINQADSRDLLRVDVLHRSLAGRSEPGAGVLRAILDEDAFVLTDSEAERLLVPIALRAGLGKPQTQAWIAGYRVDFFWPEHGLVVEIDGLRYHRTPQQQRRDLEREHALAKLSLTCRRFSYWQVARDPGYVEGVLRLQARTPGRPRAA
jgi:very-short-patch-repair endonuclease